MIHRTTAPPLLAVAVMLALAACATPGAGSAASADPELGDDHGEIAGAQEMAEPQLHLLTIDEAGAIRHLDLLDEGVDELGELDGVEAVTTEGRYAYAVRPEADAVTIVDSGVWTWSHIDHFHYYLAEPAVLGEVSGTGRATVSANDFGAGILFPASGEAALLGADTLGDGSLDERFRIEVSPHDGLLVPIGERALITEPGPDGEPATVRALDADGSPLEAADCPGARGTIATVVGVVVGCRDGALLATIADDGIAFEHIPFPDGDTAPPAEEFHAREGRPTVAAVSGAGGIRLLDTRKRSWTLIDAGEPIVRATAVDNADDHVLALTADGRVLVLSGETGERLAETEPLVAASLAADELAAGVELIADQHRAYLNGPAERHLFEIDFADSARVARTFETPTEPRFVVETGR